MDATDFVLDFVTCGVELAVGALPLDVLAEAAAVAPAALPLSAVLFRFVVLFGFLVVVSLELPGVLESSPTFDLDDFLEVEPPLDFGRADFVLVDGVGAGAGGGGGG